MKPKKLSLREMWKLYKVLKDGVGNQQEYLIDEVLTLMDGISQEDFLLSILLLYPKINLQRLNAVEFATLFVVGLKRNNFFEFVDLAQGLVNGRSEQ